MSAPAHGGMQKRITVTDFSQKLPQPGSLGSLQERKDLVTDMDLLRWQNVTNSQPSMQTH